jgi:HEAT repeat protein
MFLVQAGQKSEPLLEEAARRRFQLPLVLDVLGSLEDPATAPIFERYAQDPDPETRDAAQDALRLFRSIDQKETARRP